MVEGARERKEGEKKGVGGRKSREEGEDKDKDQSEMKDLKQGTRRRD